MMSERRKYCETTTQIDMLGQMSLMASVRSPEVSI